MVPGRCRRPESLICGHSELYSATWPASGTTRAGTAYALPTSAPLMDGSGSSSLLPTPDATHGRKTTRTSVLLPGVVTLLRTPTAQLAVNGGSQHPEKRKQGGHGPTLADEVEHLLPTPTSTNSSGNGTNNRGELLLPGVVQALLPTPTTQPMTGNGHARNLGSEVRLLPTPTVQDAAGSGGSTPTNVTLTDAVVRSELGAKTNPRHKDLLLIPTPLSSDAGPRGGTTGYGLRDWSRAVSTGEPTSPLSDAGSPSSDG